AQACSRLFLPSAPPVSRNRRECSAHTLAEPRKNSPRPPLRQSTLSCHRGGWDCLAPGLSIFCRDARDRRWSSEKGDPPDCCWGENSSTRGSSAGNLSPCWP